HSEHAHAEPWAWHPANSCFSIVKEPTVAHSWKHERHETNEKNEAAASKQSADRRPVRTCARLGVVGGELLKTLGYGEPAGQLGRRLGARFHGGRSVVTNHVSRWSGTISTRKWGLGTGGWGLKKEARGQ